MRHLMAMALMLLVTATAFAQGPRNPEPYWQWQPQYTEKGFDLDRRLEQPVTIEILGRSAVAALKLLAEKTGVALSVSLENLTTLGERKLTVIAKGCSLKNIMVQIPDALQECHWRIDTSGAQPVYELHRNAGVEETMKWLRERDAARFSTAERQHAARLARLDNARRALAMSPDQLAELEKTDLMMARSVRDPHARDMLEFILSLPSAQLQQFGDTGRLQWDYMQAPARLQQIMDRIAVWYVPRWGGENLPKDVIAWRDHLGQATIALEDNGTDHGWGAWLSLDFPIDERGTNARIHDVAIQPSYPNMDEGEPCFTRLLVATGASDEKTAFDVVADLDHAGFRSDDAKRDQRREREWLEPTDPDLLRPITLGDRKFTDSAEVQQFVADQTELSVVSDYFTPSFFFIPDEARASLPLWRVLYLLGEDPFWGDVYLWRKLGSVLVFRRADWYAMVPREIPESLIVACREKLKAAREFTLDDLAEVTVALDGMGIAQPAWPGDLMSAHVDMAGGWALLLYASLSPDQKTKLRSPAGLSYADMTIAQRRQVVDRATSGRPVVPENDAARAIFILSERSEERGTDRTIFTQLELRFPGRTDAALVGFRMPSAPKPSGK